MSLGIGRYLVAAALVALPGLAGAQRTIELGMDGSLLVNRMHAPGEASEFVDDRTVTTLTAPVGRLRVGFLSRDGAWSVEPVVSLGASFFDGGSGSTLSLDLGVLRHFATDRARAQPYLRPFVGLGYVRFSNDMAGEDRTSSTTQPRVGLGFGTKLPLVDRLAVRLEAVAQHAFETDDQPGVTSVGALFGFSFFTR